ncbi:hypothetical protein GALL_185150 [mine drainage metagenome]|uniref:Lipoprotein n=1 Tax=mine drainage metagenome TaxID=410659 RepID=A0A1J5RUS0_9ZZZZ
MKTFLAKLLRSALPFVALFLAACGGGGGYSGGSGIPTATYTVGGNVSGMANGAQVTLDNNGANPLTVSNGAFTFTTPVAYNGSYAVTVGAQPTGQTCNVVNGAGTVGTANVTNVQVNCGALFAVYVANLGGGVSAYTKWPARRSLREQIRPPSQSTPVGSSPM